MSSKVIRLIKEVIDEMARKALVPQELKDSRKGKFVLWSVDHPSFTNTAPYAQYYGPKGDQGGGGDTSAEARRNKQIVVDVNKPREILKQAELRDFIKNGGDVDELEFRLVKDLADKDEAKKWVESEQRQKNREKSSKNKDKKAKEREEGDYEDEPLEFHASDMIAILDKKKSDPLTLKSYEEIRAEKKKEGEEAVEKLDERDSTGVSAPKRNPGEDDRDYAKRVIAARNNRKLNQDYSDDEIGRFGAAAGLNQTPGEGDVEFVMRKISYGHVPSKSEIDSIKDYLKSSSKEPYESREDFAKRIEFYKHVVDSIKNNKNSKIGNIKYDSNNDEDDEAISAKLKQDAEIERRKQDSKNAPVKPSTKYKGLDRYTMRTKSDRNSKNVDIDRFLSTAASSPIDIDAKPGKKAIKEDEEDELDVMPDDDQDFFDDDNFDMGGDSLDNQEEEEEGEIDFDGEDGFEGPAGYDPEFADFEDEDEDGDEFDAEKPTGRISLQTTKKEKGSMSGKDVSDDEESAKDKASKEMARASVKYRGEDDTSRNPYTQGGIDPEVPKPKPIYYLSADAIEKYKKTYPELASKAQNILGRKVKMGSGKDAKEYYEVSNLDRIKVVPDNKELSSREASNYMRVSKDLDSKGNQPRTSAGKGKMGGSAKTVDTKGEKVVKTKSDANFKISGDDGKEIDWTKRALDPNYKPAKPADEPGRSELPFGASKEKTGTGKEDAEEKRPYSGFKEKASDIKNRKKEKKRKAGKDLYSKNALVSPVSKKSTNTDLPKDLVRTTNKEKKERGLNDLIQKLKKDIGYSQAELNRAANRGETGNKAQFSKGSKGEVGFTTSNKSSQNILGIKNKLASNKEMLSKAKAELSKINESFRPSIKDIIKQVIKEELNRK